LALLIKIILALHKQSNIYHEEVLELEVMPLALLEKKINNWINQTK
jgi:uncharacterized protein (DUF885 family)